MVDGHELAEFGRANVSGVIDVILRPPSMLLLGETELLDCPGTIASGPVMNGASAPRLIMPVDGKRLI